MRYIFVFIHKLKFRRVTKLHLLPDQQDEGSEIKPYCEKYNFYVNSIFLRAQLDSGLVYAIKQ
jgi:hypothetical protein